MSEMYAIFDEEDSDSETVTGDVVDDFDVLSLGEAESSDVEVITIEDEDHEAPSRTVRTLISGRFPSPLNKSIKDVTITRPDIERRSYHLNAWTKFKPGNTVELKDISDRNSDELHSGDFFRITLIIQNMKTDKIRLRGFRLRRTKYHHQYFDWKMNELVMVLHVAKDDSRPAFVQGMEDISVDEVIGIRDCIITSKPYPMLSFRDPDYPRLSLLPGMTSKEYKAIIFQQGRLVCRCVQISTVELSGKSYSGEARNIYAHESDSAAPGSSSEEIVCIDSDNEDDFVIIDSQDVAQNRKRRSESAEEDKSLNSKAKHLTKKPTYTFADVFCGAGGASQGAVQAGLRVLWGLDKDQPAIQAYSYNHTGAGIFLMDAHDFPPPGVAKNLLRVDILHLSPPCCYWSPAHTNPGQNDQANYEAIYTVGPILKKIKPRIATLEQTFGLLTFEQHKKNFRLLVNDIYKAGYNVRWKIQDLSEFGLPQRRKRLLIIAARFGTPLPPFPQPTHGPSGSGLKRFVSVADALEPLNRVSRTVRFEDDRHQPGSMRTLNKTPYDPQKSFLKGCITTGGGDNFHFSGNRRYTPRENSLFQSFPYGYYFTGSDTEAVKQIGNAFPPCMPEALFRLCAQTLEAFDHGLIDADADIDDLDRYLVRKGFNIPQRSSRSQNLFASSSRSTTFETPYRYLFRSENGSVAASAPRMSRTQSLFGTSKDIKPQSQVENKKPSSFFSFLNTRDAKPADAERKFKKRKNDLTDDEKFKRAEESGDIIELDSD